MFAKEIKEKIDSLEKSPVGKALEKIGDISGMVSDIPTAGVTSPSVLDILKDMPETPKKYSNKEGFIGKLSEIVTSKANKLPSSLIIH